MKINIFTVSLFCLSLFFSSCDRSSDALDPSVSVTVSSNTVKIGDEITVIVKQNTNSLSIYTGDTTHNYLRSADYLLKGKSNQDLQNSIYAPLDPNSVSMKFDFSTNLLTASTLLNGLAAVTDINKNVSLFPLSTDADLTQDNGNVVLRLQASPGNWVRALRIFPNMKIGGNKTCVTRLRFLNTNEVNKVGNTWVSLVNSKPAPMSIVTRISGIAVGETTPSAFLVNSVGTTASYMMTPDTTYQNQSVDLTPYITDWETQTGKHLDKIAGIQFFYSGSSSVAYNGKVLIQSITVGGLAYLNFDTGISLPVLDNGGVVSFKYKYSTPGVYNITVIGTNYSYKNYSGNGYQSSRGDNINANEYNSNTKSVIVPITITAP